jgi:hypothetical protein
MSLGAELPPSPAFPNLASGNHRITSDRAIAYNCIAWAAGDDGRWWWPVEVPDVHWPDGAPRVVDLASFVAAFATLGYSPCEGRDFELGREKVALFALHGIPTHAARQLPDGRWTSKLGKSWDITHEIEAIGGPVYGKAVIWLARASRSDQGESG